MAVTNLTNTTWLFNDSLSFGSIDEFTYYINFTSNNTNYSRIHYYFNDGEGVDYLYYYTTQNNIVYDTSWDNAAYKTIHITGGTDVTNANLISWLTSNATQQAATASIVLGNNTLTGVDTIKLTNANDTTSTVDFVYGTTPSGTINVKLGDTTLTGINQVNVLGTDTTYKSFGYVAQASGFTVTFAKSSRPTFATMDAYRQYSLDGTTWNNIALAMDGTSLENVTSIYFRVNGNGSNTGNISWTNPTGSLSPDFDFTSTWKTSGEVVLTGNMIATFGNSSNPE